MPACPKCKANVEALKLFETGELCSNCIRHLIEEDAEKQLLIEELRGKFGRLKRLEAEKKGELDRKIQVCANAIAFLNDAMKVLEGERHDFENAKDSLRAELKGLTGKDPDIGE